MCSLTSQDVKQIDPAALITRVMQDTLLPIMLLKLRITSSRTAKKQY